MPTEMPEMESSTLKMPPLIRIAPPASPVAADNTVDASSLPDADGTASDHELESAVLQVVQVFSKPEPDRQRLFQAVLRTVKGELTIKVGNFLLLLHTY